MDHFRFVFRLLCPFCKKATVLPRQSSLGKSEGLERLPTDEWPATFLCIACGQLSERSPGNVHDDYAPTMGPGSPLPDLWRVEFECDHENCGQLRAIYTTYEAGSSDAHLARTLCRWLSTLECSAGHNFAVSEKRIRSAERFQW